MTERLIISGFGGQGIMFLGKLIAWCAMYEGRFVTFLPAYGAEVRGGTSHCSVIISDKEIGSPCIDKVDTLIAMNKPSVLKFIAHVKMGGEVFVNASMIDKPPQKKGIKLHMIPFSDLASGLGNIRTANIIALGAYLAAKKILPVNNILKLFPEAFKDNPKLLSLNKEALYAGVKLTEPAFGRKCIKV